MPHDVPRRGHPHAVQTDARAGPRELSRVSRLRQEGLRGRRAAGEDEGADRPRHRAHHAVPVVHRRAHRAGVGRRCQRGGDRRGHVRGDGDGGGGGLEPRRPRAPVPARARRVSGGTLTRQSQLLAPTLREDPADAEVASHRLLVRAGMIRQVARGIYDFLPLGLRAVRRVETIVREEMDRTGAQEILMPAVIPAELWQESGRWLHYGRELLRLKDRYERDFCFGPTHEEVVTDLVRREIRSYRELPKTLYQIQVKFRDEIRPRFGLLRAREFLMKDAYSFHADAADAQRAYRTMLDAYARIFTRCGLTFRAVEAGGGTLGRVATPGKRTVEEVSAFLGLPPERFIKTLLYEVAGGAVVAVLVRGDHTASETKIQAALGGAPVALADERTVERVTGAPVGFAGPVGLDVRLLADAS